jgi:Ribosomal protein L18e/L15.
MKILGMGEIKAQLDIETDFSSKIAKEKVEKCGGKLSIKKIN